jgi:hypothetical protein
MNVRTSRGIAAMTVCLVVANSLAQAPISISRASSSGSVQAAAQIPRPGPWGDAAITAKEGSSFIWARLAVSSNSPLVLDISKATLRSASAQYPVIGIDMSCPPASQETPTFSILKPIALKDGTSSAQEYMRSSGRNIELVHDGGATSLTVKGGSATPCLLFVAPSSTTSGQIVGLSAQPLALPAFAK